MKRPRDLSASRPRDGAYRWTVTPRTLIELAMESVAVGLVVAAALHLLTWRIGPIVVARDILRLEKRIAEVEKIVSQLSKNSKMRAGDEREQANGTVPE